MYCLNGAIPSNVPLRHLLNDETLFASWWRSAIEEVNNWAPKSAIYLHFLKNLKFPLKIYQTRHPDINANAYTAFGVLAFIIFIGVIGVLHSDFYFWMFFTILHCTSCLILSFQVRKIFKFYKGKNMEKYQHFW